MILKTLSIISVSFLLAGCPWNTKPCPEPEPVVVERFIYPDCGTPPQRDPVELRSLEWTVSEETGFFSLTSDGYEDLGYNISEILSGVRQLVAEIQYYEECLNHEVGRDTDDG